MEQRIIKGAEFVIMQLTVWVAIVLLSIGVCTVLGAGLFIPPFPYTLVYFFIMEGLSIGTVGWVVSLIVWIR
jgi:hypothetical protein